MTICIAAIANGWLSGEIVLCSDMKISGAFGSAETQDKQLYLATGLRCLTAGYESDIIALMNVLRQKMPRNSAPLDEVSVPKAIKEALQERKKEKAQEIVSAKFGISYETFLSSGKTLLPDAAFRETFSEIQQADLRAEFVIAGFLDRGIPLIAETSKDGVCSIREGFGVAGEGRYLATSVLLQREVGRDANLAEVLYAVYEAKRYAEKIPSVGKNTAITVMKWNEENKKVEYDILMDRGLEYLETLYKEFGPKEFNRDIEMPNGLFL